MAGCTLLVACSYSRPEVEMAAINQGHAWEQKLDDNVVSVSLTAGGIVRAGVAPDLDSANARQGEVWFLDLQTGQVLWKGPQNGTTLVGDIPAPLVVRQEEAKAAIIAPSPDGKVTWTHELAGVFVAGEVSAADNLAAIVYQPTGGAGIKATGLDLATGQPRWTADLATLRVPKRLERHAVAILAGAVFVTLGGNVGAIDVASGQVRWEQSLGAQLAVQPSAIWLAATDHVLLGLADSVALLHPDAGPVWVATPHAGGLVHDLALIGSDVLVGFYSRGGGVARLAANDGRVLWKDEDADGDPRPIPQGVAVWDDKVVYVGNENLVAVEPGTGARSWTQELDEALAADAFALRVAGDTAVLVGHHQVEARALATGEIVWAHRDFQTVQELVAGRAALAGAVTKAAFQAAATIDANSPMAGGYYEQVGDWMVWRPDEGEWWRSTVELGKAAPNFGAMVATLTKGQVVVRETDPTRHVGYLRIVDDGAMEAVLGTDINVVVVDLQTGALTEYGVLPGDIYCFITAVFHESTMHYLSLFEAAGPACDRGPEMHGYRAEPAFAVPGAQ